MQKLIKKVLIPIFFMLSVAAFVSCKKAEAILPPENIRVENDYLLWDATPHTEWYLVDIDGTEYEADEPSLDLFIITTEAKTYRIQIRSVGDDTFDYQKSAWSAPYEYELKAPPLLVQEYKTDEYEIKADNPETLQGKIVIPSSVYGKPVTKIAKRAFYDAKNITSVVVPDSVFEIGYDAFKDCTTLQRIRLPRNVKTLHSHTFDGCTSLQEIEIPVCNEIENFVFKNCTSLKKLHIPQQVKKIGTFLTAACLNITELSVDEKNMFYKSEGNCIIEKATNKVIAGCNTSVIPDGVKIIGSFAFSFFSLPNGISIPSSVEKIEYKAFYYCKNTSFFIPENVTTLESSFITHGTQVTSLEVDESNPAYKSEGNCIIEKATGKLVAACNISVIPQGVKIIGAGSCAYLQAEEIVIPHGVEIIEMEAFFNSAFKKVVLPDTLTEIGMEAFMYCSNLTEISFPASLKLIDFMAFYRCPKLPTLYIPEDTEIRGAFSGTKIVRVPSQAAS